MAGPAPKGKRTITARAKPATKAKPVPAARRASTPTITTRRPPAASPPPVAPPRLATPPPAARRAPPMPAAEPDIGDALVLPRQPDRTPSPPRAPATGSVATPRGPAGPEARPASAVRFTRQAVQPASTPQPPPPTSSRSGPAARGAALPDDAAAYAIYTNALTKRYGGKAVVEGIDLRVPRGQVVGFVGPNGAGKTTTIRMLLGLIRPSGGEAFVLGESTRNPTRYLPKVGALIESPAFYPNLTGRANLLVHARLGGCDAGRIPGLLRQVGLEDRADEAYKRYSLGMKQRLGIAAALLPDPDLLILDEPTNGLDPAGIHEVRDFLRALGDQGKTVFVSSHLLAEIEKMCDHVVMLRKGRLIFQGTLDELAAHGAALNLVPERTEDLARLLALCQSLGLPAERRDERIVVQGAAARDGARVNRAALGQGIILQEISGAGGDLEQTFLAMTGEGDL